MYLNVFMLSCLGSVILLSSIYESNRSTMPLAKKTITLSTLISGDFFLCFPEVCKFSVQFLFSKTVANCFPKAFFSTTMISLIDF